MDPLSRLNALIDLAIARGDRAALLILQGERNAHHRRHWDRVIRNTIEASGGHVNAGYQRR